MRTLLLLFDFAADVLFKMIIFCLLPVYNVVVPELFRTRNVARHTIIVLAVKAIYRGTNGRRPTATDGGFALELQNHVRVRSGQRDEDLPFVGRR